MPRKRETRPPLTKRVVETAEPRAKRYLLHDGLVHGLALRVEPTGSKSWLVQKSHHGKTVGVHIAPWPDLTVEQARRKAQCIVADLATGKDPAAQRREERAARETAKQQAKADGRTVAELWARYVVEVIEPKNKPSTTAQKIRMWNRRIEPAIGRMAISEVTGVDVSAIVRAPLKIDAKGVVTGGKGEGGNLYRLLHHLFAKALAWRERPVALGHPLDGIEQPRVQRRERLLADSELAALWKALDDSAGLEPAPIIAAARFKALTGWRVSEVLELQRAYLRRDLGEVHLPDSKNGFSARPLSAEAWAVLDAISRRPGVPWLFPSPDDGKASISPSVFSHAFRRIAKRAGLVAVTPHTLRHRVVTDIANAAPNVRVGMAVSGHKSVAAFMGYVHADRDPAAQVAAAVGTRIAAAIKASPADVAELQPAVKPKRARRRG